jgi:tetratricopeptide (TPR) repeat protein
MATTVLNPFVVGGAIGDPSGRGFYGRDDIFDFVRSSLMAARRAPIVLYGQRRIGKSSILKQLPRRLPELTCVFFDLQGKAGMTLDQVLYGLAREIASALEMPPPERDQATEHRFPAFLKTAVSKLDNQPDRLVLLFDEFDVVDPAFADKGVAASTFIPYLGQLISNYPQIGFILVVGRKAEELSESFFASILKDSLTKRIGRLSREEVTQLINESTADSMRFDKTAVARVYQLTAGHPFCAQVLCHCIWSRFSRERTPGPWRVTRSHVDAALPEAIELGANGLNWIYDGLTKPTHRAFLAALATLTEPPNGPPATLDEIHRALRARRVATDEIDLASAPRELESFDVIARNDSQYRFAVPVIGAWIHENRPLQEISDQTRLYNPRAYKYFELATESFDQGNYDSAIEDFRSALAASPVFREALQGLSSALRLRSKPGDLDLAIEAYERLIDIDPATPRTPLVDMLADSIEAGGHVEQIEARFKRLKELDADGLALARANRLLAESARNHAAGWWTRSDHIAQSLFTLIGDAEGMKLAAERIRRKGRIGAGFLAGAFVLALAAWSPLSLIPANLDFLRYVAAALAGAFAGSAIELSEAGSPRLVLTRAPWTLIGALCGLGLKALGMGSLWALVLTAFLGFVIEAAAIAERSTNIPDRVKRKPAPVDNPERKRLEEILRGIRDKISH